MKEIKGEQSQRLKQPNSTVKKDTSKSKGIEWEPVENVGIQGHCQRSTECLGSSAGDTLSKLDIMLLAVHLSSDAQAPPTEREVCARIEKWLNGQPERFEE